MVIAGYYLFLKIIYNFAIVWTLFFSIFFSSKIVDLANIEKAMIPTPPPPPQAAALFLRIYIICVSSLSWIYSLKFESQDTVCMKAALEAENRVIEQRVCWVRLLMGIEVFLGGVGGGGYGCLTEVVGL